jgi:hypothetical protein
MDLRWTTLICYNLRSSVRPQSTAVYENCKTLIQAHTLLHLYIHLATPKQPFILFNTIQEITQATNEKCSHFLPPAVWCSLQMFQIGAAALNRMGSLRIIQTLTCLKRWSSAHSYHWQQIIKSGQDLFALPPRHAGYPQKLLFSRIW